MSITRFQPIRGFRDLYPEDKAIQNYIFAKLKETARLLGFAEYDGPILEPIDIYLGKTSRELIERQTFQIKDKKDEILIMRPEMTPSLARMISQKEQQLTFPLRLFNLGLRFRYEAPQKGREREFYQADFDILGADNLLADAEILNAAVMIFLQLGAKKEDFVVYINSRKTMEQALMKIGLSNDPNSPYLQDVFSIIDKKEKVKEEAFIKMLMDTRLKSDTINTLVNFLNHPSGYESAFGQLLTILKTYNIDQYVQINPAVVRGLDYYTGLIFEVKEKGKMTRSLLGGGRYDNLIETFGASRKISGVGFATSDVVLWEFLKEKKLLPSIFPTTTRVLVTVFPDGPLRKSIEIVNLLRKNKIPAELYPDTDKKLDKQLKYADKNKIPFIVIIGPEEIEKSVLKIKNMKTTEQKIIPEEELVDFFLNYANQS